MRPLSSTLLTQSPSPGIGIAQCQLLGLWDIDVNVHLDETHMQEALEKGLK